MKALIFPNDPLIAYVRKGELKERYFNPKNIFEEVHFVTFSDVECEVEEIQKTIGNAKGYIHRVDRLSFLDMFFPQRRVNEIYEIVKDIEFDVVRSYNPSIIGYIATELANKKSTKSVISIHNMFGKIRPRETARSPDSSAAPHRLFVTGQSRTAPAPAAPTDR